MFRALAVYDFCVQAFYDENQKTDLQSNRSVHTSASLHYHSTAVDFVKWCRLYAVYFPPVRAIIVPV